MTSKVKNLFDDPITPNLEDEKKNSQLPSAEATPDFIEIRRINLPDGRALTWQHFGWENTIADEIERLIFRNELQGKPEEYVMRYVSPQEAKVLESDRVVEDYWNELMQSCTIYIEDKK